MSNRKKYYSLSCLIILIISAYLLNDNDKINTADRAGASPAPTNNATTAIIGAPLAGARISGAKIANPDQPESITDGKATNNVFSEEFYPVARVIDGDTLAVSIDGQEYKIRLIGINSPESVDPRRQVECFGPEASAYAKELLTDRQVKLTSDPSQAKRDKYGRLLAYVHLTDGTFFNLKMIENGYAYEYTYKTPYQYQSKFRQAQAKAKSKQFGLWSPTTCNGKK